jgi:hypothetical protein
MKSNGITKKFFKSLFLLLLICVVAETSQATLLTGDPAASISGTTLFLENLGSTKVIADVEYAVYDPGQYPSNIPAGLNNKYIYAYQIFNTASNINIDFFSVGLNPGAIDLATDQCWGDSTYGAAGGIFGTWPIQFIGSPPASVGYGFFLGPIGVGQHSEVLLFSSDYTPTDGHGIVAGGAFGELPTPIPEPTTIGLLITGILVLRNKTKKYKRKK